MRIGTNLSKLFLCTALAATPALAAGKALDKTAAAKAIQEKQQLEVSLAWELLEVFNDKSNGLIDPLRDLATLALWEMREIAKVDPVSVQKAIDDEKDKQALLLKQRAVVKVTDKGTTVEHKGVTQVSQLSTLVKEVGTMDAQYISDVIRLYGVFVEMMAKASSTAGGKEWAKLNTLKDSYRKGAGFDSKDNANVWNKGTKEGAFGRHREAAQDVDVTIKAKILEARKKKDPKAELKDIKDTDNDFVEERVKFLAEWASSYETRGDAQNFLVSMKGGQSSFKLAPTSTLNRIDKAFGVVPAADISGTTADNIFFLQKFGGSFDSIFQMLPLATIVAGAHHSTLEVALPLSQSKIIDYEIGRYTTLMPSTSKHKAKAKVAAVLKMAEEEANNHFLLAFYSSDCKTLEGAYEFSAKDKAFDNFRKFAKATSVLESFATKDQKSCLDKAAADKLIAANKL